jgi:hypothetical protein
VRRPALACCVLLLALATVARAALTPEVARALADSQYVYIQSERKSGELGKASEIWFFVDGGKVFVGSRPTSWRVKRIKAGRTRAHIAVGSPQGPSFDATGTLVKDPNIEEKLMRAYAKKYPEGWPAHADSFRDGFKTGERVLVMYTPR